MIRLEPMRSGETRDYQHDWSPFLGADTIASQTTVGTGITVASSTIDPGSQSITMELTAVTAGTAQIVQTITTVGGQVEKEVFTLAIRDAEEPVSLAEAKEHLRKTTDDEDALIASYVSAARRWVEEYTGHILVRRVVTQRFADWGDYLALSGNPISALTSIVYTDADGEDAEYEDGVLRNVVYPAAVYPPYGGQFPTLGNDGTITATFTAGYAEGEVPEQAVHAIKILITSMYEGRGSMSEDAQSTARFLLRALRGAVLA